MNRPCAKLRVRIRDNRHTPTEDFMKTVVVKLQGYCRYYGISYNRDTISDFFYEVRRLLYKWLNRRSQKKSLDWWRFNLFLKKYPLLSAKIYVSIF